MSATHAGVFLGVGLFLEPIPPEGSALHSRLPMAADPLPQAGRTRRDGSPITALRQSEEDLPRNASPTPLR